MPCVVEVVYLIPLSCGKKYVGQTGRCLNVRLTEHSKNVRKVSSGNLAKHCRVCRCQPKFELSRVLHTSTDKRKREKLEAEEIRKLGSECISAPSYSLPKGDTEKKIYKQRARRTAEANKQKNKGIQVKSSLFVSSTIYDTEDTGGL